MGGGLAGVEPVPQARGPEDFLHRVRHRSARLAKADYEHATDSRKVVRSSASTQPVALPPERTADRRAGVRRVQGGVKYRKGRVMQVHRSSPAYTLSISRPAYSQE